MLVPSIPTAAEDAFLRRHARYAFRLRIIRRDNGVEVEGEVDSYYRKQLVLRDALLVWGRSAVRGNVTVHRPVPTGG